MCDESNESIVVVSPSMSHVSSSTESQSIQAIRETSSMASNSVMTVNEANECFKLESELSKVRAQLNQVLTENESLKRRLNILPEPHTLKRSPDEFIDIKSYNLAEQIERHLHETDTLFRSENDFKPAMENLVRNLWSIIARELDERTLERTRMTVESLSMKLDHANELIICANQAGLLETELSTLRKGSEVLKQKLVQQNEYIKSLIGSLQRSMSHESSIEVISEPHAETRTPVVNGHSELNGHVSEEDDDDTPSPGVSPSASFANHIYQILNQPRPNEVRSIDPTPTISSNGDDDSDDDTTLQHEQQSTSHQPNGNARENDFLLYPVNDGDFIGVNHTDEVDTHNLNITDPDVMRRTFDPRLYDQTPSSAVYQCPICKTTIDPKQIAWSAFVRHMEMCNIERNRVCMFCLKLYPNERSNEFEEHVQSHIENEF